MLSRTKGENHNEPAIKKASTAIAVGEIVTYDNPTGHVQPAVAGSTNIAGIAQEQISATDSDYTTARPTVIDVPRESDEFEIDVQGAVPTQAMVGDLFNLIDSKNLNIASVVAGGHMKVTGIKANTGVAPVTGVVYARFNPAVVRSA